MTNLLLFVDSAAETGLSPEYTDGYCLFVLICVGIPILIALGIMFFIGRLIWRLIRRLITRKSANKGKGLLMLFLLCSTYCAAQTLIVGNVTLNNEELKKCIQHETKGKTDVKEIASICCSITRRCLTFSTQSKLKDLRQLSFDKKTPTHCVGYAKVVTACCNYAFEINHIDARCDHIRGPLKIMGLDLTKIMSTFFKTLGMTRWVNFTKDHDCGLITYKGKKWRIDPSLPW